MDLHFQQHIPAEFPDNSRVWIYQCNRIFTIAEALEIEEKINLFLSRWKTHGSDNTSYANLFFGQFLVIMADETTVPVSGCSTDSSVRFIKKLEKDYQVSFFDRTTLAFVIKEKIQLLPMAQLNYAIENKFIDDDTLYFNNLVASKKEWINNWIIPIKESWLKQKISHPAI